MCQAIGKKGCTLNLLALLTQVPSRIGQVSFSISSFHRIAVELGPLLLLRSACSVRAQAKTETSAPGQEASIGNFINFDFKKTLVRSLVRIRRRSSVGFFGLGGSFLMYVLPNRWRRGRGVNCGNRDGYEFMCSDAYALLLTKPQEARARKI